MTAEELSAIYSRSKKETRKFLQGIKKKSPPSLDNIVHRHHFEIFDSFNCLDCANCCKNLGPRVCYADVERISKHLKMKPSLFTERYLKLDEENDYVFKSMPCPFLMKDNYCSIYESRPRACKEYPHTDRRRFIQLLDITEKNLKICPAVYYLFEKLKKDFK